jgi:hypothetical protein
MCVSFILRVCLYVQKCACNDSDPAGRMYWRHLIKTLSKKIHTSVAGLLARSLYPGGSATGNFDTGFSWFPCV